MANLACPPEDRGSYWVCASLCCPVVLTDLWLRCFCPSVSLSDQLLSDGHGWWNCVLFFWYSTFLESSSISLLTSPGSPVLKPLLCPTAVTSPWACLLDLNHQPPTWLSPVRPQELLVSFLSPLFARIFPPTHIPFNFVWMLSLRWSSLSKRDTVLSGRSSSLFLQHIWICHIIYLLSKMDTKGEDLCKSTQALNQKAFHLFSVRWELVPTVLLLVYTKLLAKLFSCNMQRWIRWTLKIPLLSLKKKILFSRQMLPIPSFTGE